MFRNAGEAFKILKEFTRMTLLTIKGIAAITLLAAATAVTAQDTTIRYDDDRGRDRTVVVEHDDDNDNWRAYTDNELNFSLFGTGTVGDETLGNVSRKKIKRDGRLGLGANLQYFPHRIIGLEAEGYSENAGHHLIDNASINLVVRIPFGNSGFAPYLLGGAGRQFDPIYQWTFGMGGGLEFRFSPHVGLFVDGRWVVADASDEYGLGRAGLRFGF
jgi:hypothetical protein